MKRNTLPTCATAAVVVGALWMAPAALGQTCQPHWSEDLWASAPPGEVRAMTVFDDGTGPVLYMGTVYAGNSVAAAWDGERLRLLGSVTGSIPVNTATGVFAEAFFDDGSGPALHIAGSFTAVDGTPANGAARLTPSGWEALGMGTDGVVRALAVHDDGSDPALYAAVQFQHAGGSPASCVARWDGASWSALGAGLEGGAVQYPFLDFPIGFVLCSFDDGSGPALYAGGNFHQAGGAPAAAVARWRNDGWEPVGNGLFWLAGQQGVLTTMLAYDAGSGPSLYAAGRVNFGGLNNNPLVVRWDGASWHPVGTWIPSLYMTSLAVADFWGTPTLHVSVNTAPMVLRLEGETWAAIGNSNTARCAPWPPSTTAAGTTSTRAGCSSVWLPVRTRPGWRDGTPSTGGDSPPGARPSPSAS